MQKGDVNDALKQRRPSGGDAPQQNVAFQPSSVQHYVLATQLQALAGQTRQTSIGLIPGLRGASPQSVAPSFTLPSQQVATSPVHPQTVAVASQNLARLYTPLSTVSVSEAQLTSSIVTSVAANALQRQLSSGQQGLVGVATSPLSPPRAYLQPITSHPIPLGGSTLSGAGAASDGSELQMNQQALSTPTSSVSASGGTIHHHGLSPSRGAIPPLTNLQQNTTPMSLAKTHQRNSVPGNVSVNPSTSIGTKGLLETKPAVTLAGVAVSGRSTSSLGPSPKKRAKMEEKPPASQEIARNRKIILEEKHREMREIKENYIENLTELFFLQNSGNLMDYFAWKKRPTPQLVQFLKSGNLDSDDEEEHGQERRINDEVKVITSGGSNVPMATPVAISTTLPPSVAALSHQAVSVTTGILSAGQTLSGSVSTAAMSTSNSGSTPSVSASLTSSTLLTPTTIHSTPFSHLQSHLIKTLDTKPGVTLTAQSKALSQSGHLIAAMGAIKQIKKSPPSSPSRSHPRQHSATALYDGTIGIGSQEAIVERAKQEAQVMQRVADLRKEGMWTARRLPRVQEPPRNKAHWDYLLEEMQWLAADFQQERKWKKAAARKIASMVSKYWKELELKELRAEKEEGQRLKRIAGQIAKQVKEFWTSIEKVVQYKQQTRLDEKRKKALDLHLNFIVDQTEKYSTWLTESLARSTVGSSVGGSLDTTPEHSSDGGDDDFEPEEDDSDDEETIEREETEGGLDESQTQEEVEALHKESEVPLEELLKSLPQGVLDKPATATLISDGEADDEEDQVCIETKVEGQENDQVFEASENEVDIEETIDEQESHERKDDHTKELEELQEEGDMTIEELADKYAGAYDSDFEVPEDSGSESETEEYEESSEDEEDEEEEEEEEMEAEEQEDVGLEYLMNPEAEQEESGKDVQPPKEIDGKGPGKEIDGKGPGKEITDIAAEAQSVQPKGYTLETTEVKTPIPFLLKHTLREYQHVGLDWLATMYEKKLNGILADEMGLGKTIQTIALLAHLACVKGIWGPHLIVVPTSVMLNWEMEFKKWCPAFKILTYYGSQKERKQKRTGWTKTNAFHVCITSYKLVIQDHQSFRRKKWKYFILDEAQNIKNFKSQRWQTLLNFSSQRRLLLTGTPLQNSLMELWSLMHFLMPHVFQSHREFKEWFANPLTGMVEGSHEYNESLIRRLHKVLRPFLLRRLKDDVEKQMPKKYEHIVMCHLSKRQRFLYDEFMSQGRTKETLASGHFMSVINILMQLRKVCNHPSLFDPRPIVSPFQMDGLVYHTSSSVLKALEYDPFKEVNLHALYPGLTDMELDLPAFIAHRVKKLQTPRKLIEEIDTLPDPPPRLKPGKLKPIVMRSVSPMVQSGRSSPLTPVSQARAASPLHLIKSPVIRAATPTSTQPASVPMKIGLVSQPQLQLQPPTRPPQFVMAATHTVSPASVTPTPPMQATIQAKMVPHTLQAGAGTLHTTAPSQIITSQPITVQIQQTEQGTRLMIPTGQLSQLPAGFIQIVQTSTGQHLIATSAPTTSVQSVLSMQSFPSITTIPSLTNVNRIVNGPPTITTVPMQVSTAVTSVMSQVKTTPVIQLQTPSPTVSAGLKPIMRVAPMTQDLQRAMSFVTTHSGSPAIMTKATTPLITTAATTTMTSVKPAPVLQQPKPVITPVTKPIVKKEIKVPPKPKSALHLDCVQAKVDRQRKEKLASLSRVNRTHCEMKPVYGQDLCQAVDSFRDMNRTTVIDNTWHGLGHVHCACVHRCKNHYKPDIFWKQTQVLSSLVYTPEQYLEKLSDILSRFVFVNPTVMAPRITMHASHPPPSFLQDERRRDLLLHQELSPLTGCLHRISSKMTVQFPELRLIQYDCGKLQTLDILLRRLKSGSHRVLIFTQMTKMLNILEAFLNFHGHRYLRLDGTTHVEQRQFLMDRFNADKRIFVFILSTRSGGIGVNLTGADTVIFYDSDWNPTMDAQAQDRCHRIGQTRDVHIYRLVSEKTIEENILKKANQKRMLGDMAIEGGNFTTAFFKEQTITELFSEPSGMDSLVEEKAREAAEKERKERAKQQETIKEPPKPRDKQESTIIAQFEKALGKAEDETDANAVELVKAEQKAELAEFDEDIPWDEKEAERRKEEEDVSKAEQELAMLDKELTPVERYAVAFMETQLEPFAEELKIAEDDIQQAKQDWELARLKNLKEEEERRAELEEDEMLYTCSRDDAYSQVKKRSKSAKKSPRQSVATKTLSRRTSGRQVTPEQQKQPVRKLSSEPVLNKSRNNQAVKLAVNQVVNVDGDGLGSRKRNTSAVQQPKFVISPPTAVPANLVNNPLTVSIPKHTTRSAALSPPIGTRSAALSPSMNTRSAIQSPPAAGCRSATQSPTQSATASPTNTSNKITRSSSQPQSPTSAVPKTVVKPTVITTPKPRFTSPTAIAKNTSPKENSNPNTPQPWSNPNLVIRTRRASLQEQTRKCPESESPESVVGSVSTEVATFPVVQPQYVSILRAAPPGVPSTFISVPSAIVVNSDALIRVQPDILSNAVIQPAGDKPLRSRAPSQSGTSNGALGNDIRDMG